MRRGTTLGLTMLLLAGCATKPVATSDARQVAPTSTAGQASPGEPSGQLVVVRDKGWMGSGCYISILVNGQSVARLDTGEKVTLEIKPGRLMLGATPDGNGLCKSGMAQRNKRETQVTVELGDKLVYRVATSENGELNIGPSSGQ